MQTGSHISITVTPTQYNPTRSTDVALSNAISGILIIFFPTVVICAIVVYRRKHRATVRQRRIQHLHRLWQLDSSKKLS